MSILDNFPQKVMDGKKLAEQILDITQKEIVSNNYNPRLAAIIVGDNEGALTYQRFKERRCADVGVRYSLYKFGNTDPSNVKSKIRELDNDPDVCGVMVQLPIPHSWDENELLEAVSSEKDVDGLNFMNVGRSYYNSDVFVPCAAEGTMRLLAEYNVEVEGKKAVVLGRGRLLGTPIALLLEKKNAFVTKIHSVVSKENLEHELETADIVVSATGHSRLITGRMLKQGVITIDCANTSEEREFAPDTFERTFLFSTVPGGIGPMTIAILLENVLKAYKKQRSIE